LDDTGKMATIPNEFRESCQEAPRFEIRADNRRFPSFVSPSRLSLTSRDPEHDPGLFFQDPFSV
jgi:hypothetical protein